MKRLPILTSVLLVIAPIMHSLISSIQPAIAQKNLAKNLPICSPPNPGEYLLLVISPTQDNQQQLRSALPTEIKTSVCNYTDKTVTRIPGFNKIDDANRWGKYIQNVVGLSAIITTLPPQANAQRTPQQSNPQNPQTTITTSRVNNYNPRVLGEGYAVLVDYSNRPELVEPLRKAVGGDVGFVSYGQRPYLLAVYTTNQKEAYNTLQRLSETGFLATLVDGRQVVLLRSIIR